MENEKRKPTGTIGDLTLYPDGRRPKFTPIQFPTSKAEIESQILHTTLEVARKSGLNPYDLDRDPEQNPENSFDFTLPTAHGEQYLDLMEVAPLEGIGGSYKKAQDYYNHGKLSDYISGCVNDVLRSLIYRT